MGIAGSAIGGAFEIPVSEAATTTFKEHHLLTIVGDIADKLARLGVEHGSTARHFDNSVLAFLAEAATFASRHTVGGEYVALEFEVEQSPQVAVAAKNDASAIAAIATVGTTFGHIFGTMKVRRTRTALT